MKIVLNIIGQYRTFEKTYQNIYDCLINNNEQYEFDIILNTDFKNEDIIDYNKKIKKNILL